MTNAIKALLQMTSVSLQPVPSLLKSPKSVMTDKSVNQWHQPVENSQILDLETKRKIIKNLCCLL
jgi:hypothetical protein